MLVRPVSVELLMITQAIANRQSRPDLIEAVLQEHKFGFEDVYAATQRLYAFSHALACSPILDVWIMPPSQGEIYSQISPALWEAVAAARLEYSENDPFSQVTFAIGDLEQFMRCR